MSNESHDEGEEEIEPGNGDRHGPRKKTKRAAARLQTIRHKVVVLSGKGGVGKSTVAVHLAVSLRLAGKRVGLLDADLHGPSVPKLLHLEGARIRSENARLFPVDRDGLKVISIGMMLRDRDEAVVWRGPMKHNLLEHFLEDVEWGELDYLIVDCPPGTGDEPLSVVQLLGEPDGAVIVTTPQQVAIADVRRSISFCKTTRLPVLGVVENMSGLVCPDCGRHLDVFGRGGGEAMARELEVPFLGAIPLDPIVVASGESGRPVVSTDPQSAAARAFARIAQGVIELETFH